MFSIKSMQFEALFRNNNYKCLAQSVLKILAKYYSRPALSHKMFALTFENKIFAFFKKTRKKLHYLRGQFIMITKALRLNWFAKYEQNTADWFSRLTLILYFHTLCKIRKYFFN